MRLVVLLSVVVFGVGCRSAEERRSGRDSGSSLASGKWRTSSKAIDEMTGKRETRNLGQGVPIDAARRGAIVGSNAYLCEVANALP